MSLSALAIELSPTYFRDGVRYVEAAARERATPTLFDLISAAEASDRPPMAEAAD